MGIKSGSKTNPVTDINVAHIVYKTQFKTGFSEILKPGRCHVVVYQATSSSKYLKCKKDGCCVPHSPSTFIHRYFMIQSTTLPHQHTRIHIKGLPEAWWHMTHWSHWSDWHDTALWRHTCHVGLLQDLVEVLAGVVGEFYNQGVRAGVWNFIMKSFDGSFCFHTFIITNKSNTAWATSYKNKQCVQIC